MRRYTIRLSMAFIFSFLLLIVVVVFFYTQINNHFFEQKAEENIWTMNQSIATRIDVALNNDYEKLEDIIQSEIALGNDPLVKLDSIKDELNVRGRSYVGFGIARADSFVLSGEDYYFHDNFMNSELLFENVAMFSFKDAFWDEEEDVNYVFFQVDSYLGYFEADPYFTPLFEESQTLDPYYFIILRDGLIQFQKEELTATDKLFDVFRLELYDELYIQGMLNRLDAGEAFVERVSMFGTESFAAFHPLSEGLSTRGLYVVQQYDKSTVMGTMAYLSGILLTSFILISLLFMASLSVFYRLLEIKNTDIESSRMTHYYIKPYIVHVSGSGRIRSVNKTFKRHFSNYKAFKHLYDFKVVTEYEDLDLVQALRRQKSFTVVFHVGEEQMYIRFIPIRYGFRYALVGDDVTKFESTFNDYRSMALYNKVTGLPNLNFLRSKLQDIFDSSITLAQKNSIVAFNISGFRNINRLMGEKLGDKTLVILSRIAKESLLDVRATLYNTEADHFVVLFENVSSYEVVMQWVNGLIERMKKPIDIERNMLNLDIKIGVFHIEPDSYSSLTPESSIEYLNLALNRAKESMVYQSFVYDIGLGQYVSREQVMEADLVKAIEDREFMMYLQPQYNNVENKIVAFEALVRWNNPKYVGESPARFIELAENNNMIIDIGRIAMDETFKMAKEIESYDVQISINVSPVQILQAGFVNDLITTFEKHKLKKHSICIEITETFLMTSFGLVIEKLKILENYGFDIHLDDFGTGYSSMLYLKDLPINTIKIDQNFIKYLSTDKYSRAIVSKIIALAKSLDLNVIAEGVEDEKQNQFLQKNGCYVIQGYLISKAVSKDDAIKLLEDYNVTGAKKVSTKKTKKKKSRFEVSEEDDINID